MEFKIDIKIFLIALVFLLVNQIYMYILFMIFAIIHECFHLLAGIILGYKVKSIRIMPLGLSIAFNEKEEEYNTKIKKSNFNNVKKIIILLMGPISNIVIAFFFMLLNMAIPVYINILIAIFNLLPIYPLDGGRILSGILHIIVGKQKADDAINNISMISTILITAIASVLILYLKNIAIFLIVMYLWYLVLKENNRYLRRKKYIMKILENKTNK